MPEGDSVFKLSRRMQAELAGRTITRSDFRVPQHATADLAGARILEFVPRAKHMLMRMLLGADTELTLHTHLRMDGSWTVLGPGKRLPRARQPDARVLLGLDDGRTAAALSMPVVELLRTADEHHAVGHLGPDPLADDWDADLAVRRIAGAPERGIAAALLDQRGMSGLGNLWVNEVCFLRGMSPWRPVGEVDLPATVRLAARMLRFSAHHPRAYQVTTGDLRPGRQHWVVGRAGSPCLRCGTVVRVRAGTSGSTADTVERRTWWCPYCQPGPARPGHADRCP